MEPQISKRVFSDDIQDTSVNDDLNIDNKYERKKRSKKAKIAAS